MKLREWDFSHGPSGGYVEVEYPDSVVKAFVDWFRTTSQWKESPEQAYARWLKFERELTEAKEDAAQKAAVAGCPAPTLSGEPCKARVTASGLCAAHTKAQAA
jgi:hypothetical protein